MDLIDFFVGCEGMLGVITDRDVKVEKIYRKMYNVNY